MANCQNSNERLFGGAVVLEVADGCPDVKPLESEWKALAAGTSKGFDFNPNSVTSDADDGGGYVETIITNSDFTLSFEGEVRKKDNPTLRYSATARSDTKYGFTAAIPNIQLNIWNGDTVQLPSRYLIATVEELDSQLWTVNSIKPNTDNTVSLTVAEYSDSVYE